MDIAIIWPDGQRRDILVNTTPISNGSGMITGAVGAFSDITELNAQRNALRKAHEEMEKRVEERTDELLALNKSLEVEIRKRRSSERALRKFRNEALKKSSQRRHLSGKLVEDGCVSRFDYE